MTGTFRPRTSTEAGRSYEARLMSGFVDKYCRGAMILDVGYRSVDGEPSLEGAIGVDLNYPGYDGLHLPFESGSVDVVFSSHCLEHVANYRVMILDWHRVLRVGGFIVCVVPHQHLYEKKLSLPSRYNCEHKRFYTPAKLLAEFEEILLPNSYRVRHLADNDAGYDYGVGPMLPPRGRYEIELVVEKIALPTWNIDT